MIWTCTTFKGMWPTSTAAVVAAPTAEDAAQYLNLSLAERGIAQDTPVKASDMCKFSMKPGTVDILSDGNY